MNLQWKCHSERPDRRHFKVVGVRIEKDRSKGRDKNEGLWTVINCMIKLIDQISV